MNIKTAPDFELLTRLEKTNDEREKQELLNELAKRPTSEVINQLRSLGYGKAADVASTARSINSKPGDQHQAGYSLKSAPSPTRADMFALADEVCPAN